MLDLPRPLASSGLLALEDLWEDLTRGRARLLGSLYWEDRCFVTVERNDHARSDVLLSERRVHVLQQVLLGRSQKEVAFDFDLAVSTVALTCSTCLRKMTNNHLVSRAPGVLVMAAHAAKGFPQSPALVYPAETDANRYVTLETPRLDLHTRAVLSPAEAEVIRLLVQGHSHTEMAALRRTSPRTVANQLAAAFKRLGVSGRADLLGMLARSASARPTPSALVVSARDAVSAG